MKVYVFVAWALDTVHQIILLRTVYIDLVKGIDDPLVVEQSDR